jgi:hypothetical protein
MEKILGLAAGVFALCTMTGAEADELQISKLRYDHSIGAAMLVCPGAIAPADCNVQNAVHAILSPWAPGQVGCGVQDQALLAGSGIAVRDGQYVKVVCARDGGHGMTDSGRE